jgi:hypothetical protein
MNLEGHHPYGMQARSAQSISCNKVTRLQAFLDKTSIGVMALPEAEGKGREL